MEIKYDFAFCVVSYNQEKYVYQHLESIRFNVEKYGKHKSTQLIFSDDCSIDGTVEMAKKWLDSFSSVFDDVKILIHEKNQGTIRNIFSAIDAVRAKEFKVLGCDDLYFDNDIYKIRTHGGIVIANDIEFWEDGRINKQQYMEFFKMYCNRRSPRLKSFIKRQLTYDQVISPVASFVSLDLWKNKSLRDFLLQYKYIEDLPLWYFLFNMYDGDYSISVTDERFTLYRLAVGVSTNLNIKSEDSSPVRTELLEMRKVITQKKHKYKRTMNPYRVLNKIQNIYYMHFKFMPDKKNYMNKWNEDLLYADNYYSMIQSRAKAFEAR